MAFTTTAAYYEALANPSGRLEREGPFLKSILERAPGPRVLDLACGTGVHTLFFAQEGAMVTGADISAEMVAFASAHRPHRAIQYIVGDMRSLPDGTWDLIICLGNSLALLEKNTDLHAVFRSAAGHLAPEGLLVTQTLNYARPAAREPRHRVERGEFEGAEVTAVKSLVPHGERTLLSLAFFADDSGAIVSLSETAILRNWTPDELRNAAETAGLTVDAVYGGYDGSAFDGEKSSDVLLVAQKPA